MTPEMTEIYNEAGAAIGTIPREEAERDNHIIQNVIVFVFNALGKVWIQKRPMTKLNELGQVVPKSFPGLWDVSACGAVLPGEDELVAAKREQLEEMGFESDLQHVETFMNVFPEKNGTTTRLSHLFIGVSEDIPQPSDEVDEFVALPHAELRTKVVNAPQEFIPSFLLELDKAVKVFVEGR